MKYVRRDPETKEVIGVSQWEQEGFEPLPDNHPDILARDQKDRDGVAIENKIQAKIRETAIADLKTEGEIPQDYKDKGR